MYIPVLTGPMYFIETSLLTVSCDATLQIHLMKVFSMKKLFIVINFCYNTLKTQTVVQP